MHPSDYPNKYYYSWSYYMSQYYTCTGTEATLAECSLDNPDYYGYCDSAYYDGAGVVCSQALGGMFVVNAHIGKCVQSRHIHRL